MIIAFIWIVFCFVVASGASNRGRSWFGWFVLSLFLSPLISAVFLLILGQKSSNNDL